MNEQIFDVVIVGAGPVGLWLACELKLAGINVCILERRLKRMNQSRALAIHGRTLEVFALRGLADRFLAHGKPMPIGIFAALKTPLDFSNFETSYPYVWVLPQAQTESLIEQRALELEVQLLRGYTVEQTGLDGEGIFVKGVIQEGANSSRSFRIRGKFLVGADGSHSRVRQDFDIEFSGTPPTRTFALGDVHLDMPKGYPPAMSIVNTAGFLIIIPLGDNVHHRVILLDAEHHDVSLHQHPLKLEELLQSASKIIGSNLYAKDPLWLSRFTDETRLAANYRKDKVFLAGDAAHIHTPAGGQGMNVGIQDAHNLGWKLANYLNGYAPEALLDSYEAERRPIGQYLYENTLAQTALISAFDPAMCALRTIVDDFLHNPSLNQKLAGELSGFGVSYPHPLPLQFPSESTSTGGQRVGDQKIELIDGTQTPLYHLLASGSWLNLTFSKGSELPLPTDLNPKAVTSIRARQAPSQGILKGAEAALIRPDGYTAQIRSKKTSS